MTGRLADKVVLITGTAGGQGRAAARLFAAEGAHACKHAWPHLRPRWSERAALAEDHPVRTIAAHIPPGRVGDAEEIARCALFPAGDEASYVTGADLVVDGGWSAVLPGAH